MYNMLLNDHLQKKKKKRSNSVEPSIKSIFKANRHKKNPYQKPVSHLSKNVLASAKSQSINTQRIKFLKMLYPAINILLTTIIWQWSTTDLTS